MPENEEVFGQFELKCSTLGIRLSERSSALLQQYCTELQAYNEKVNLVSNADLTVVLRDHVLDSLTLIPLMQQHLRRKKTPDDCKLSLVDIGSGAGFPGIVLAIQEENLHVVLIESVAKKATWLKHVTAQLQLSNRIEVVNERAEAAAHNSQYRESFDFATARAVGKLDLVMELTLPFLCKGGLLLAQRSTRQLQEEQLAAPAIAARFGGKVLDCTFPNAEVTEKQAGILAIEHTSRTAAGFPRQGGKLGS
jgi:16S rRNA (guanine527-N7)-methyltransferase